MFKASRAFSEGWKFHIEGVRFGFKHFSFLCLSVLPFLITLSLYIFAFYMFTLHADDLLDMVWQMESGESSRYVEWLYWLYVHLVKCFLYFIALVIMFYTFIMLSNVLASPIYDHIVTKYERTYPSQPGQPQGATASAKGILRVIGEEIKKAVLMFLVPLPLIFIPLIGPLLGFVVAAVFIAWDYVDFSLSRDYPMLKDRLKAVWRHKFLLLGFGCPLLIPFFGLLMIPFAILGSIKLYSGRMKEAPGGKKN
jgi:CysZ protein